MSWPIVRDQNMEPPNTDACEPCQDNDECKEKCAEGCCDECLYQP